jgi:hypothetical protein
MDDTECSRRRMHIMIANNPTRVPVWIEKSAVSSVDDVERHRYLIERDMTIAQVVYIIRKRIGIKPQHAIFLFVGDGVLPPNTSCIGDLYKEHADANGMLYIRYRSENTFGYSSS